MKNEKEQPLPKERSSFLQIKLNLGTVLLMNSLLGALLCYYFLYVRPAPSCQFSVLDMTISKPSFSSSPTHSSKPHKPSTSTSSSNSKLCNSPSVLKTPSNLIWSKPELEPPPCRVEDTFILSKRILDKRKLQGGRCLSSVPTEYQYPADWPERRSAGLHWENFGKGASDCLNWEGVSQEKKWFFTSANGSQVFNGHRWCYYATEEYLQEQREFYAKTLLPHIGFLLCSKRTRTVLDVGGGVGDFAVFMSEAAPHAQVITLNGKFAKLSNSEPYVPFQEIISERGFMHLTHNATEFPYPFASRTFDLIFNKNFIKFVFSKETRRRMFVEWDRLVRPGGYVVFWVNAISEPKYDEEITKIAAKVAWKRVTDTPHLLIFVTSTKN